MVNCNPFDLIQGVQTLLTVRRDFKHYARRGVKHVRDLTLRWLVEICHGLARRKIEHRLCGLPHIVKSLARQSKWCENGCRDCGVQPRLSPTYRTSL
jgi:hypothetical protein